LEDRIKDRFEKVIIPNDSIRYCIHYYRLNSVINYFYLIKQNKDSLNIENHHFSTIINNDTVFVFTGVEYFSKSKPKISSNLFIDTFIVQDSAGNVTDFIEYVYLNLPPLKKAKLYLNELN